ncbi:unnamed protein product [Darwinula stevensoni]|uniref:Ral guanine nucleotide dissociation stimulator-like 1 n=1 Tax=Darwinula stevensoni TaxID=69355 RepID=A0A7R8WZI4_9CRUS|nr:unnamed protein product [Darwinula stevensoni]CAG0880068.1 unnamed protein product [Darwinula stevensoni]
MMLEKRFFGGTFGRKTLARQTKWFASLFDPQQQPTWRLWGEDREEGAIYTVYLKKVRYHRPSKSVNSDSEDEISHLEWETVKVRLIKAGTLEKLVWALAASDTGELECTMVHVFLATYRAFATAEQVLLLIVSRYKELGDESTSGGMVDNLREQHQRTLRQTLAVWLDMYPEDFNQPPSFPCLMQLLAFLQTHCSDPHLESRVRGLLDSGMRQHNGETCQLLKQIMSSDDEVRCTSPVPNGVVSSVTYSSLLDISNRHFAEQLTRMDMELFRKLRPHQCLGAIWSRRDRPDQATASVSATVEQFNAVSFRVLSTVLMEVDMKPALRAKIIAKWIDIAQELRMLKNFSSLKAIISGLQSTPIYRLRKVWLSLPREKGELFEELARLFSEDNNRLAQRELLQREGTAKVAEVTSHSDKQLPKLLQRHNAASCIKLLQGAAGAYHIEPDSKFQRWFESCIVLDDKESFELSCLIEPQGSTPGGGSAVGSRCGSGHHKKGRTELFGELSEPLESLTVFKLLGSVGFHQKSDSLASNSSGGSSQFFDATSESLNSSLHETASLERKMSTSSSSSSLPSLDASMGSGATNSHSTQSVELPTSSPSSSVSSPYRTPEFYIIRVSLESHSSEVQGVNLYKSIMLSNSDRTPSVIRSAMMKHGIEGKPEDYTLAQILPHGEMVFPSNANVYYAINTHHDLNFILRHKKPGEEVPKAGITMRETKVKKKLLSLMT